MLKLSNIFKKNEKTEDEAPQAQRFIQKHWLPLSVCALCVLLLLGYAVKSLFFSAPDTKKDTHNYDCHATLAAVGDISLSAEQLRSFHTETGTYEFGNCFRQVAQTISSADIAIGNLEGSVTEDLSKAQSNNLPVSFLSALSDCGFDYLQTANSYSIQNGISSIETTANAVEYYGMKTVGTYRSAQERSKTGGVQIVEVNGIRFAIVGFTKGLKNMHLPEGCEYAVDLLYTDYDGNYSSIDEDSILTTLENAKAASPDFIIAMVHWGSENETAISESQEKIADLLIGNGVDVIIGSHPHIVGKIEHRNVQLNDGSWKNVYIAYSLGDFLTASEQSRTQYSLILNFEFSKDSKTGICAITDVSYTPTYCTSPSRTYGTTDYAVIDSLNAIQLREESYYDAISEALCEKLWSTVESLAEQTESDYQIKKGITPQEPQE